jgi:hypothetical protein
MWSGSPGGDPVQIAAIKSAAQHDQSQRLFNVRTAKALGLTIPPSVLLRVDQVIG